MKSVVKEFEKREREGALPYYVAKCVATQGDADANVFNADGSLNVMALQSRTFNLTKCFFPATEAQCKALETGIKPGETTVNLNLFQVETGKRFNIVRASDGEIICDTVEVEKVVEEAQKVIGSKVYKKGDTYKETVLQPKVYTQVSLVLFCNDKGESVEGNPEEIAKRNFNTGVQNGAYLIVEQSCS